jgi:hypothetical protein
MRHTLLLAAGYNLAWGAWVVLFPDAYFDWAGMKRPNYPEIWQCVGMIVGVYGLGYAIAASDPLRHWPIVLVGLLGKILGPLGFAKALYDGTFTPTAGLIILSNDLIWWVPFALILAAALRQSISRPYERARALDLASALSSYRLAGGESLADSSYQRPLLVCFIRHYG